jgi:hypothetical protein
LSLNASVCGFYTSVAFRQKLFYNYALVRGLRGQHIRPVNGYQGRTETAQPVSTGEQAALGAEPHHRKLACAEQREKRAEKTL